MILKLLLAAGLALAGVTSVQAAPSDPQAAAAPDVAFELEVQRLREALAHEVRGAIRHNPAADARWIDLARAEATAAGMVIDRPQLLVVVDRSPRVQQLMVLAASPQGDWRVIGGSGVSTGQKGRWDHYVTPRGVFHITNAILGYRAEGTLNENGIRGLGAKGMRVWDFGWQVAMKGWTEVAGKPDRTPIRLMLHATDPDKLEQRIGRPASQGCIRVTATMNRFLDQHGVLDAEYERAAANEIRFRALLLPGRQPSPLAGNTLIVVDSSERAGANVADASKPAARQN